MRGGPVKATEAKAIKHGQEGEHSYENPEGEMVGLAAVRRLSWSE